MEDERGQGLLGRGRHRFAAEKSRGRIAEKLSNCWRCDFMNKVKKEEEPEAFGFSTTRLGLDRVREKTGGSVGAVSRRKGG